MKEIYFENIDDFVNKIKINEKNIFDMSGSENCIGIPQNVFIGEYSYNLSVMDIDGKGKRVFLHSAFKKMVFADIDELNNYIDIEGGFDGVIYVIENSKMYRIYSRDDCIVMVQTPMYYNYVSLT